MNWNAIPTKLQRVLFDCANTIADLQQTSPLKGQMARFLHNHKDDQQKLENTQDNAENGMAEDINAHASVWTKA